MTIHPQTERLTAMMNTYTGPKHTVTGVRFAGGQAAYQQAGVPLAGVAPEDVIYEIGSITKVFTAILLCLMIEEGKVDPQAPLREMAPDLGVVPEWITPERLTSHTSGLPNYYKPLWKAVLNQSADGPYASFARAELLDWFRNWSGKDPGATPRHAYSNLGYGLLGEALAMQTGRPFVDLLTERVIAPLGLQDTTDQLSPEHLTRFATPRLPKGKPVNPWVFEALAGAGCLKSTGRDLALFSDRVIHAFSSSSTPLDRAIARSSTPLVGLGKKGSFQPMAQAWGWISINYDPAAPGFLFHSGGTAGSTCGLYICAERAQACAVLSNNGIAGNLWGSIKLDLSDQPKQAQGYFTATDTTRAVPLKA
ncbi:serine hydrolase domain-containing protein [Thalassovita autumnalis]|nr:serine hydrolase domain-containing protein [Thalassovita autumnalis]